MEKTKKKLLLIAEDDLLSQEIVKFSAQSIGLKVLVAGSVAELIKCFDSKPNAILVDVHLPDMGIEELLLLLKEACKALPNSTKIALMTAGFTPEIKELCEKYGFFLIVEKPITEEILVSLFGSEEIKAEKRTADFTGKNEYQDKDSIIDLSFYIKGVGDNPGLLKESLSKVEKSWNGYIENMDKEIAMKNPKKLHYWAHTIKGSLGFIKADDGVALAQKICEEAKASHINEAIEPLRQLKDYMKKVRAEVDKVKERIKI